MAQPGQTNSQVIGDLIALNQGEIATAKVAQDKAVDPEIKKYAHYLYVQHTALLQETRHLSHQIDVIPQSSSIALTLQKNTAHEMKQFSELHGSAFDRVYIPAMIKDHQAGIKLLEHSIKKSTNQQLTRLLEITVHHIRMHLNKALIIEKNMH
jgi:putative membrane protein